MKDKMYKIEKNVALPKRYITSVKFPFNEMEVGDSFYVLESDFAKTYIRGQAAIQNKANPDKKFTCRMDVLGMRVWRIN